MSYLQTSGQLAHTMVLLWSDNGTMWGEHNRTSKFVPWLPSVNVPMWLRWDGHVAAGGEPGPGVERGHRAHDLRGDRGAARRPPYWTVTRCSSRWPGPTSSTSTGTTPGANGKVPTWAEIHTTHWAYIETYNNTTGALAFQEYYDLDCRPGRADEPAPRQDHGGRPAGEPGQHAVSGAGAPGPAQVPPARDVHGDCARHYACGRGRAPEQRRPRAELHRRAGRQLRGQRLQRPAVAVSTTTSHASPTGRPGA